jgi:hypothetical protein
MDLEALPTALSLYRYDPKENADMLMTEDFRGFVDSLVDVIKSRFPNSSVYWKRVNMFGSSEYQIRFYLAKNLDEMANQIDMNDAMRWCFSIPCNNDFCLADDIVIELNNNSIIRVADKNDPKEKYCVYGRVKVPYRKIKGTTEQCILKMKKFIDKTAEMMIENAEAINQGIIKGLFTVADKVK